MARVHGIQTAGGWAFGEWLEQIRKARGLTLDEISRETKIPLRNLEALEHGDLGMMPTFYERAEVRAVARAVGIDERVAIGRLDAAVTPAPEMPQGGREREGAPWWKLSDALVSIALGFGVVLGAAVVGRTVVTWTVPAQPPANQPVAVSRPEPDVVLASEQAPAVEAPVAPETAAPETAAAEVQPASFTETEIVVTTDPSGAQVTVNGISWGVSPVTIRHLPPGAKRIRATKEGFAASEQVFTLDDSQRQTLNLRLTGAN